ncbi:MAG: Rieske 2Fe-2S domain-containing protein [Rhodobacteraceae bacterium]|nr:Rieske 2Fe-2S domain-containing protein [Paracoccaceae bacterium]
MSDALKYLLEARPEAMGAYFKFLKGAGTHLDQKTRDLISVITKVDVQTEKGLKQYLARALRNGCTPNEIIDALLTAFPTLGLAKIVWAVDIILSMEINDFAVEALNGAEAWHDLGAAVDFPDGEARRITAGYRAVFVWRRGDALRVYDSTCPHQVTNIPELAICDNHLTCPKHNWKFDLETGDCIEKGDQPLKTFEARIENGVVQAWW